MYLKYLNKITVLQLTAYANTVSSLCQKYPFVSHTSFWAESHAISVPFSISDLCDQFSWTPTALTAGWCCSSRGGRRGGENFESSILFIVFVIEQKHESQEDASMQWFWGFVRLAFYFLYVIQNCVRNFYSFDVCWTAVGQNPEGLQSCVCVFWNAWVLPLTCGRSYTLNFAMLPICCMFFWERSRNSAELSSSPWLLARGCFSPLIFGLLFGFGGLFFEVYVFIIYFCTTL